MPTPKARSPKPGQAATIVIVASKQIGSMKALLTFFLLLGGVWAQTTPAEQTTDPPAAGNPNLLEEYIRRREHSLEWIIRKWLNEPGIALFYEGNAVAADKPAVQITVLNAKNDSVTLYIDANTHLPIKKTYAWRDPTD